jgi:hypothetical protein
MLYKQYSHTSANKIANISRKFGYNTKVKRHINQK